MKEVIRQLINTVLEKCFEAGVLTCTEIPRWSLEVPRNSGHGDLATNIALVLASVEKRPPKEIAEVIIGKIHDPDRLIRRVEYAPPGFINFFLEETYLYQNLKNVVVEGKAYGRSDLGKGLSVQIEFVSANPTGPLHIGHGRGAAVGDALANILEAVGYRAWREYYINDVGNQIEMLGRSVYLRYLQLFGQDVDFPAECYQGEYIIDIAKEIGKKEGEHYIHLSQDESIEALSNVARSAILAGIEEDLDRFRIQFNRWFSEKSLFETGEIHKVIDGLKEKGLVYENEGALWFKSTSLGDDKDRVVVKSDGSTTYFASDIAYHANKYKRGFERVIDVWGADHHGYVSRMKGVVQALDQGEKALEVVLVQLVNLLRGGVPVTMSTRAGEFTTLKEVVGEVGVDATRYLFLTRNSESHLDFDLELAKKKEKDNPVYYIQYAHARICSILREARDRGYDLPDYEEIDIKRLALTEEIALIKQLAAYPEILKASARTLEPHRITYYLDELAATFHSFYNKGWIDRNHRVLTDEKEVTKARLYLVRAIQVVIQNALSLLGVEAPEEM
jgi:arginyl-tRNA synthetase